MDGDLSTPMKTQESFARTGISARLFWALSVLLVISIATNAYFVQKLMFPQWRHTVRLWFIPPPEARPDDHLRGNPSAAVTIIEYGDFQCPYCARLHSVLRELTKTDDVRWIFRHYTLNSGHEQAPAAATAAECAGEQERFWDYSDALYEKHASLGTNTYLQIAEKMQLDMTRFSSCLTTTKHQAAIDADNASAEKLEFVGVPTWFVNGKRVSGAMTLNQVREIVNAARSAKS